MLKKSKQAHTPTSKTQAPRRPYVSPRPGANWDPLSVPPPRSAPQLKPDVQPRPRWLPPTRWIIVGALVVTALIAASMNAKAQVTEVPGAPRPITEVPGAPGPGHPRAQLILRADGLAIVFEGRTKLEIVEDGTIEFSDAATIDLSPTMITSNSGHFWAWAWIKVGGQYRLIPTYLPPGVK